MSFHDHENHFLFIFYVDHYLKVFIEFVKVLLLFYLFIYLFGHEACGILAPCPGIEPIPTALEGEVLITGSPGKSPSPLKNHFIFLSRAMSLSKVTYVRVKRIKNSFNLQKHIICINV